MAQRRMMSMHIIDTDAFMDMPHSAQCLYMHLLMRADDDGFIASVKKIMRMVGTQDDDLKILFSKKFVLPFESGVCVIKHWKIHNLIRSDRYNETKYIDEKNLLALKDNGSYSLDTIGIPDDNQTAPIRDTQVRLGKVSKGKVRLDKNNYGEFENVLLTEEEYLKLETLYNKENADALIEELSSYIESSGKKYKSHYATLLNWAKRKMQEHVNRQRNLPNKSTADFSK